MKSISDTLETIRDITSALPEKIELALAGGQALIFHGVERTTLDVDFCVWGEWLRSAGSPALFSMLQAGLPERFQAVLHRASATPDDPVRHDLIVIEDTAGEYPRIDILVARYRWELEGIRAAVTVAGAPVPVLPKPHLAALKLLPSGHKDTWDVHALWRLMTDGEREATRALARQIGRERKLERILTPPADEPTGPAGEPI